MKKIFTALLIALVAPVALAIPQITPLKAPPKTVFQSFQIECSESRHITKLLSQTGEQVVLKGKSEHPQAPGFTVLLTMAKDGSYTWVIENQTNGRACIVDYGKMQRPGVNM